MSEKEKQIPIGYPEKAKSPEVLPVVEVANKVIWVNPDFPEMPFDLKKGKSTNLGLFLTPESKGENFSLEVDWRHGRSALLGRVIFKDKQGNFYRDVDLKGIGPIISWQPPKVEVGEIYQKNSEEFRGIFNKEDALEVKEISEKFIKAGIRTERFLAIIELDILKEIFDEKGNKLLIEAKQGSELFEVAPVIAVRAFGTKNRIFEARDGGLSKLEDAKKMVSQEIGINNKDFSFDDYLEWFAETLGKNIGLMHNNYWAHTCLTIHNITLDCRIIDLDEVKNFKSVDLENKTKFMMGDWQIAKNNLAYLWTSTPFKKVIKEFSSLEKRFNQVYIETLGYKPEFIK